MALLFFIPSIEKGGEGFPRIGLQCLSLFNKKCPGSTHGHNTAHTVTGMIPRAFYD